MRLPLKLQRTKQKSPRGRRTTRTTPLKDIRHRIPTTAMETQTAAPPRLRTNRVRTLPTAPIPIRATSITTTKSLERPGTIHLRTNTINIHVLTIAASSRTTRPKCRPPTGIPRTLRETTHAPQNTSRSLTAVVSTMVRDHRSLTTSALRSLPPFQ